MHFADQDAWQLSELAKVSGLSEVDLAQKLNFWVQNGIIVKESRGERPDAQPVYVAAKNFVDGGMEVRMPVTVGCFTRASRPVKMLVSSPVLTLRTYAGQCRRNWCWWKRPSIRRPIGGRRAESLRTVYPGYASLSSAPPCSHNLRVFGIICRLRQDSSTNYGVPGSLGCH